MAAVENPSGKTNEALQREINHYKKAEEQLELRNKLLSTLLDISNLVSSNMEIKSLLEGIFDRLQIIIEYRSAKIFLIEEDILRLAAHRSQMLEKEAEDCFYYYKRQPVAEEILKSKRPLIINDILGDDEFAVKFRTALTPSFESSMADTRCWMGLPLSGKDRVIGILTIAGDKPGCYTTQHMEVCMAFANQVSIELENARLYNETNKRADELKTMFSVQQAITSRLELNSVLQLIADEAKRLTASQRSGVFLIEGSDLCLSVFSGSNDTKLLGYRISINNSVLGQAIIQGKPLTVNFAKDNPVVSPGLVELADISSFMSVPLISGSKKIGIIAVADKVKGCFGKEDENILSMLATTAIIGIENARMYEEERRRHKEDEERRMLAEGLRDILAALNSVKPLQEILDYIIHQAVRLLGTDTGSLFKLCEGGKVLRIEASVGLPEDYMKDMDIPVGVGIIGVAVRDRKPVAVTDTSRSAPEELLKDPVKKQHTQWLLGRYSGMLSVPVICKDEIYGGIVLYYRGKNEFLKDEIDLAMTFADQVALAIDNAKLKARAEELAVASERSRLARDLHDAVTQTLFSAGLIAEVLPRIWDKSPDEGRKRSNELRQLTRGALAEMRTLLLELRPAALAEAKVDELFRHLAEAATGRARIPVSVDTDREIILPTDVKIAFYRIAQEALNNIIKHSDAENVHISIKDDKRNNAVFLKVRDDGCGFDINGIKGSHLGLGIMKERAAAANMEFNINSVINHGTEIEVKWEKRKGDD